MTNEQSELFDDAGFLELLASLQERTPDDKARTGVLTARIFLRDGVPWAMSVGFESTEEKAA
jgi:hypothetical protein